MSPARAESIRVELERSKATTLHVAQYPLESTGVSVANVSPAQPLDTWCAERGLREAISGGFMVKPDGIPLGYLRIAGGTCEHRGFRSPWHRVRSCLRISDAELEIGAPRASDASWTGDVLQAGPLLVRDGRVALAATDPEGFATTAAEFDQDFTEGRHPRAAIATADDTLLAVVADGRSAHDAGLTLWELAALLTDFGVDSALNLDGGSAAALVSGGHLRNTPRDDDCRRLDHPSETPSAIVLS
jgi:hypothetical protein